VIYLRHRLHAAGVEGIGAIGVVPTLPRHAHTELCAELGAAFPQATVADVAAPAPPSGPARDVPTADAFALDVVVVPFIRRLHRRFLREKTPLVVRALRSQAPVLVFYDVAHRRTDVVRRDALPAWYARRLLETLLIAVGRRTRWALS
jgi:hypothetical protein